MIGGYLIRVTIARDGQAPTRLLYVVAEEDEDRALAYVRTRSRAVQNAAVDSLGPVTKAELKRRGAKPGDVVPL